MQAKSVGIFLLSGLTSVVGAQSKSKPISNQSPNIVLIFMDDMGYGDLGSYGAKGYKTPNLDKLANEGMRFTNFYAAQPVSSASRVSLMTGCYANRVGFPGVISPGSKIGLNPEEEIIPEILKRKGYATAAIGKWHMGDNIMFLPLQNGFDEYLGIPYSNDMWPVNFDGTPVTSATQSYKFKFSPLPLMEGNSTVRTFNNLEEQGEITTIYTERAVKFINNNKKKNPFFLYLAHTQPHIPLAVSSKFKGKSGLGLFADVMMEIDWSVGQVMKALKDNGLDDNTLVIFTSDNGPWLSFGNHAGSAGILREGKLTTFEGGQREPCLMRWPGHIPKGCVCDKLATTMDLLPTFCEITGAVLPVKKIDGLSILSLLKNQPNANPRNHFYYYYNNNSLEAIRKGNWKLILPHASKSYVEGGAITGKNGFPGKYGAITTEFELYDLLNDPGEKKNVFNQNPEIVKEFNLLIEDARKDLGDDLTNNPGNNRRKPGRVIM